MNRAEILRLLDALNDELNTANVVGEIYLVGGAVMTLVLKARPSTVDLDAYFAPSADMRKAAARVAARQGCDANWLNDAVKGFMSAQG